MMHERQTLWERHGPAAAPLELWGGIECSVVRIGDRWRDLVREMGHHDHGASDIGHLAALGLRTLRYPVLWERAAEGGDAGWAWQDGQMEALRRHGIRVVAGLVHHGSGPRGTSLLDPGFAGKLARHAAAAAERYPDVYAWTPVNEPLTTARFSCLYGYWHPHVCDEGAFLRAVVNQCWAILQAMRAIRMHVPQARFVHTEDVGRVFATAPLADQASYENERRWLSLDLLCGKLDRRHPWRTRLEAHGAPARQLDALAAAEAAPDLIGANYYVTSERFLDHRVALYDAALRGGNGRMAYVDTEAVRVALDEPTGWAPRLREVWERYRRPIAVTEAHLGCCDADEPVRWLLDAWDAAQALRAEGADIRAVTAWALLGSTDWDSMLRDRRGHYEASALDTRFGLPVATPLAAAIAQLAAHGRVSRGPADKPGWWRRPDRLHLVFRQAAPVGLAAG